MSTSSVSGCPHVSQPVLCCIDVSADKSQPGPSALASTQQVFAFWLSAMMAERAVACLLTGSCSHHAGQIQHMARTDAAACTFLLDSMCGRLCRWLRLVCMLQSICKASLHAGDTIVTLVYTKHRSLLPSLRLGGVETQQLS